MKNMISCCLRNFALLILVLFFSGCGKNPHGFVPVTVTALYLNAPVHEAIVVFHSKEHFATGLTNKSGVAVMMTKEPNDGVFPDVYKVTIMKQTLVEEFAPGQRPGDGVPVKSETKYFVPAKYALPETSGLTAEVKKEGKNEFVFALVD
ncbi:MAG: hypothetical protein LBT05_12825 [Planctomycetaceae bacterium]|jgi:hypothetical protein|nr:hypothetical protein [Planctomycetaceae bacterium]